MDPSDGHIEPSTWNKAAVLNVQCNREDCLAYLLQLFLDDMPARIEGSSKMFNVFQ